MKLLPDWKPYGNVDPAELDRLANNLVLATVLVMALPLAGSLSRLPYTGWLPVFALHLLLYATALILFLVRSLIDARIKAGLLIVTYYLVPAIGIYSMGQLKGGIMYLPASIVIAVFFFGPRLVAMLAVVSAIGLFFISKGYISGHLTSAIPLEVANTNVPQWMNFSFSLFAFFVIFSVVMFGYRDILAARLSALERQRDEILKLKNYDQLTGLATLTRATEYLEEMLEEARATNSQGALILVRLDKIEEYVDELGFNTSGDIIKSASHRLASLMRQKDMITYFGGNRFLIVIPELQSKDRVELLAQLIHEAMEKPFRSLERDIIVGCTIGVTRFPADDLTPTQLIQKVGAARFKAEKSGIKTYFLD